MVGDAAGGSERLALVNGRLILPYDILLGKALLIEESTILDIVDAGSLPDDTVRIDAGGRYIAPGLVDIHTHGALGHTFNEPTAGAWGLITAENARRGVTSLLATLATADVPALLEALACARSWMRERSEQHEGAQVLGVHLEGPYFSPLQKGAQDPAQMRTPDDGSAEEFLAYRDVLRMVTFAPELPGALALTARLARLGIVPAAGHSAAHDDEVWTAMQHGLRHMIHLWSGQSSTVRVGPWRKPGMLEAALTFEGLTGEIIADNRHLPPTLMKLAYKCLGPDRLCAVSDATNGAGLPDGERFRMGNMEYEVADGVGMMLDRSAFAGSTTLLGQMVPILHQVVGVPLVEAVRMTSLTPARIIGISDRKGSLQPDKDADVVVLDDDLRPFRVMIGGRWLA
jgi:N-acetylglucosamine-6-phosphate deacetylase